MTVSRACNWVTLLIYLCRKYGNELISEGQLDTISLCHTATFSTPESLHFARFTFSLIATASFLIYHYKPVPATATAPANGLCARAIAMTS